MPLFAICHAKSKHRKTTPLRTWKECQTKNKKSVLTQAISRRQRKKRKLKQKELISHDGTSLAYNGKIEKLFEKKKMKDQKKKKENENAYNLKVFKIAYWAPEETCADAEDWDVTMLTLIVDFLHDDVIIN